jgi:hypothetical protein
MFPPSNFYSCHYVTCDASLRGSCIIIIFIIITTITITIIIIVINIIIIIIIDLSPRQHQPTGKVVAEDDGFVSLSTGGGMSGGAFPFFLFPFALSAHVVPLRAARCLGHLIVTDSPSTSKHTARHLFMLTQTVTLHCPQNEA